MGEKLANSTFSADFLAHLKTPNSTLTLGPLTDPNIFLQFAFPKWNVIESKRWKKKAKKTKAVSKFYANQ